MGEKRHRILLYPEPRLVLQLVALRFLRKLERCGWCAFFDADGTLFDALPVWVRRLNAAWGTSISPADIVAYDFAGLGPPTPGLPGALEVLGPVFRDSQVHLEMQPMPGAVEALMAISRLGIPIVICTKRPIEVYRATKTALRDNGIPFDLLILSGEKTELARELSCRLSVEDNPTYAQDFAQVGIPSLLLDAPYNKRVGKGVIRIRELREAVNIARVVKFLRDNPAALLNERLSVYLRIWRKRKRPRQIEVPRATTSAPI
jgi:uncharacterized HAD superfamily protein